jgi:hypothetical protein
METIVQYLLQRWDTLSKAPDVFLLSVLVVGGGCYALINALFKTRLQNKDAIIEGLKAKLERKEETLAETHDQLARLRTEQAATLADQPAVVSPTRTPAIDVAIEEPGKIQRDVTVSEALAYAQFHQWGLRFIDAAGMEGNQVSDALDRLTQLAADGELTIWGKRDEAGVWQKIPADHWLEYRIEWFGLLKSNAFTEARRSIARRDIFREVMTSRVQVEKLFPPPPALAMQVSKVLAPSVQILRTRILDARDRFDAMDAGEEELARIRQTMSSLALSDDPVWQDDALEEARRDMLHLWERLSHNADWIRKRSASSGGEPNYFRNEIERSELLMEVNDAADRLDAGLSGRPIPSKQYFGPDAD